MKIAIVTDMHIGGKSDSKLFGDFQERFFLEVFFPYLDANNIKIIFDLGDTFDRRKYINFLSLKRGKELFFDQIEKRGITYHALVGNHTTFYTNTNDVNSMDLLLKGYKDFHLYEHEAKELELGSTKFLMLPWITKSNYTQISELVASSDANVVMGHLELQGFEMLKGTLCTHGLNMKMFKEYEAVYSGHFHHPSKYQNIEYLGAPYEMTWSDYKGNRGFHIFDTETRSVEKIQNPFRLFYKIDYDDTDMTIDDITSMDTSMLKDTYIKVIIKNKTNALLYDMFMNKLADEGAADIKSIDDSLNLESVGDDEILDETQDTKEILHTYIDSLDTKINKNDIKITIDELYLEAMNT